MMKKIAEQVSQLNKYEQDRFQHLFACFKQAVWTRLVWTYSANLSENEKKTNKMAATQLWRTQ